MKALESTQAIRRSRAAGERMDRVALDFSSPRARGFDISEYQELGELAREGLQVIGDAPPERRAILLGISAFADFLCERLPVLEQEWESHAKALSDRGELPAAPSTRGRERRR